MTVYVSQAQALGDAESQYHRAYGMNASPFYLAKLIQNVITAYGGSTDLNMPLLVQQAVGSTNA